ncbi:DNA-binding transcriptional regulator, LysR family [Ferrimonas sediminum]|uniref:DNA-binding transcriptional regulator, LysR family n=1 Tax=Ferrimonas sediminum TaxID=718193 RepID=A0A1G8VFE6_9GAMM|nr:LysR family transcriptional regulator [Ferrimonas sediminum]SDJ64637.1 DNA-binding transcriptional regulator, LysR family [Ferrimonas sediminum]
MDVKGFTTFLEVARERHFGRAADRLNITQAAVSARIKQLEEYFDTTLFVRQRNNIHLTSSGERLVRYAEVMVSTLQQARDDLKLTRQEQAQLTIAGTPNIWDAYLQHCLGVITETLTGYAFCAETLSQDQLNRALLQRTLDMGILFEPVKSELLECRQMAQLPLVLVSTRSQAAEQAVSQDYVYLDWGLEFSQEHARLHPNLRAPSMRTSGARIALDVLLSRGGAAYLPLSMAQPFLDSGQLHLVVANSLIERPVYLAYRKDSPLLDGILEVAAKLSHTTPAGGFTLQAAAENASLEQEN